MPGKLFSTPDRIRTCDLRFRKPLLYPLSYRGVNSYKITTCNNLLFRLVFLLDT